MVRTKDSLSNFCCQLMEVGDFGSPDRDCEQFEQVIENIDQLDLATIATTVPTQVKTISYLTQSGFEPVAEWRSPNTKNLVTLWFRNVQGTAQNKERKH